MLRPYELAMTSGSISTTEQRCRDKSRNHRHRLLLTDQRREKTPTHMYEPADRPWAVASAPPNLMRMALHRTTTLYRLIRDDETRIASKPVDAYELLGFSSRSPSQSLRQLLARPTRSLFHRVMVLV
jgi:hypothetical protein